MKVSRWYSSKWQAKCKGKEHEGSAVRVFVSSKSIGWSSLSLWNLPFWVCVTHFQTQPCITTWWVRSCKIPFLLDDFLQVHQCPHDLDVASGITWFSGSRIAELQHIIAGCIPGCIRLAFSGSHLSGLKHSHLTYFEEQWLLLADIVEARWKTQGNHGMTNRERWYGIEWHQNWWGAEQFFLPLHWLVFFWPNPLPMESSIPKHKLMKVQLVPGQFKARHFAEGHL